MLACPWERVAALERTSGSVISMLDVCTGESLFSNCSLNCSYSDFV